MSETVWTPDQKQKQDVETAAELLREALRYHAEAYGRLESAFKTLTGDWHDQNGLR